MSNNTILINEKSENKKIFRFSKFPKYNNSILIFLNDQCPIKVIMIYEVTKVHHQYSHFLNGQITIT